MKQACVYVQRACGTCRAHRLANTDQFFALSEQFHMRLLAIANNRWRDQMVADLSKTGRTRESAFGGSAVLDYPQVDPERWVQTNNCARDCGREK